MPLDDTVAMSGSARVHAATRLMRLQFREDGDMDILIAAALAIAAFIYAAVPDAGAQKPSEPMEDSAPADDGEISQTINR